MSQTPAQEFFDAAAEVAPFALLAHEGRRGPGPWVVIAFKDDDELGVKVLMWLASRGALDLEAERNRSTDVLAVTVCTYPRVALSLLRALLVPPHEAVEACLGTPPGRFTLIAISHGKAVCKDVDRLPGFSGGGAAGPAQSGACHA